MEEVFRLFLTFSMSLTAIPCSPLPPARCQVLSILHPQRGWRNPDLHQPQKKISGLNMADKPLFYLVWLEFSGVNWDFCSLFHTWPAPTRFRLGNSLFAWVSQMLSLVWLCAEWPWLCSVEARQICRMEKNGKGFEALFCPHFCVTGCFVHSAETVQVGQIFQGTRSPSLKGYFNTSACGF